MDEFSKPYRSIDSFLDDLLLDNTKANNKDIITTKLFLIYLVNIFKKSPFIYLLYNDQSKETLNTKYCKI